MLRFMLQDKLVLFIKEIIRKIGSVVPKKKKKRFSWEKNIISSIKIQII